MPHPLADLDGKRKYVFSVGGEDFYLRVVTSASEAVKHQEAAANLASLMYEMKNEEQKRLQKKGESLKILPEKKDPAELDEWVREEYPKIFDGESRILFILENAAKEFAVGMSLTINDFQKRQDLQVPESVGTFVYVDDLVTAEKYRGRGLFSVAFDKVLTMLANPKRAMPTPLEYSVSMSAVTAVRQDGSEVDHVMNLPVYAAMWQSRFVDNEIQNRWQSGAKQSGLDRMPLQTVLGEDGKVDEEKVHDLMVVQKAKAQAVGQEVRGLYLEGEGKDHEPTQEARKAALAKKAAHGFTREKTEDRKGWHPDKSPTQASADGLVVVDETLVRK